MYICYIELLMGITENKMETTVLQLRMYFQIGSKFVDTARVYLSTTPKKPMYITKTIATKRITPSSLELRRTKKSLQYTHTNSMSECTTVP